EVATLHIEPGIARELYLIRMASIGVDAVAAEGSDLDGVAIDRRRSLGCRLPDWHKDHPKLRSDRVGLRENPHHFIGRRRSGHVIVGRFAPEDQIAYAAAGKISGEASLAQCLHDRRRLLRLL